jgi:hypothetical protein
MLTSTFCPVCKFKNKIDAERCAYCGTLLHKPEEIPDKTTEILGEMPSSSYGDYKTPSDYQHELSAEAIALFIMEEPNPILIEKVETVVLGRSPVDTDEEFLDLTQYGALRLGVSRRHARISYSEDNFLIEDLHSANGTRLDQKRLTPGVAYSLNNNAVILLGGLRINVQLKHKEPHPD